MTDKKEERDSDSMRYFVVNGFAEEVGPSFRVNVDLYMHCIGNARIFFLKGHG